MRLTSCVAMTALWLGMGVVLPAQDPAKNGAGVEARDVVQKVGKFFELHCHGGDDALAERALDAVERVWPLVAASFGVPDAVPKAPLPVHLYRTVAGYEAADQQLTNGKFRRNLAMTFWGTRSSHVALQPPCTDAALRAFGLPGETVELLAWEATHLARSELCANFNDHPAWFVDGLAATTGRSVCEAIYSCGGVDNLPTAAEDLVRLQRLQMQKKLPSVTAILDDTIDDLDFGDRYAARAVFFRFLQSEGYKGRLAKVMQIVRGTGGGDGYGKKVLDETKRLLGGAVDRDFAVYVQKTHAKWEEVFRSLLPHGKEWQQSAFPNRNAVAWNLEPIKGGKLSATGKLRILPGGRQQMNFLFGRTEAEDFYSVAFVADQGFTVFRYDGAADEWKNIGAGNAPALRLGYSTDFAVESSGKDLVVKVDGMSWNFELPVALPKNVFWGIGAQAGKQDGPEGSAGFWSDLVVGAKKK